MGTITRSFANNITSGGTFDATDLTGTIPSSNIADASVGNITDVPALVATTKESSDPPSPVAGQIWYNTTDRVLRGYIIGASWASGGNLNTGRATSGFGVSTPTGAVVAGEGGSPVSDRAETELYDGTSWTEVNDVPTARQAPASGGTQTAGLQATGYHPSPSSRDDTYEFDGTTWTSGGDTPTQVYDGEVIGTQTAALYATTGEILPLPTAGKEHYHYDGTSWSDQTDLSSTHVQGNGFGTTTSAAIIAGGRANTPGAPSVRTVLVEEWNGSAWTEVGDINTARSASGTFGPVTSGIMAGGNIGPTRIANVESWDGTSWTETSTDLSSPATSVGSNTTSTTNAFIAGGSPAATRTEEYSNVLVTSTLGAS
jgi:hypothetical protein